jgi:hypothetical protein
VRRFFLVFSFFMLAAAGSAQSPEPSTQATPATGVGVEEAYLAKDDGNGKAGDPVSSFFTTDIPIYCVVQLNSTKPAKVKMNFVAVSVPGVKPDYKVVSTSYSTKDGQSRVNFTGKPNDKWDAGKYRVEIFVDGKLAKDLVFDIRPASGSPDGAASFQPKSPPRAKTVVPPKRNE